MSKYTLRHLHRSNVLSNYPWSHDGQSVSPVTCQDCLFLDGHNLNCRSDLESKIASAASKEAANLLRRWKKELHSPVHMGRFMNCSWDIVSCKNLLWNFCKATIWSRGGAVITPVQLFLPGWFFHWLWLSRICIATAKRCHPPPVTWISFHPSFSSFLVFNVSTQTQTL